ncbi:hypothetical protein C2W62_07235 [Candidatus Entotheonella serta]|nr:hypothetical protein C2W62_07235 [Candidatus Entotheonella serta]
MANIMVIAESGPIAQACLNRLSKRTTVDTCQLAPRLDHGYAPFLLEHDVDTLVYIPQRRRRNDMTPDLVEAETVLAACTAAQISRLVVVSSAAIYGAGPHNPGFMDELRHPMHRDKNTIGDQWTQLETLVEKSMGQQPGVKLTILRPVAVPTRNEADYFSRIFRAGWVATIPMFDPAIQVLSPDDLAQAIGSAVEHGSGGVFNVAPDGVIPLRQALGMTGARRMPTGLLLQRMVRWGLAALGLTFPADQLEYIRYAWTVSNEKIKRELGFAPEQSSVGALRALLNGDANAPWQSHAKEEPTFDDFGKDLAYIESKRRWVFKFFYDYYWRIEVEGGEHIPRQGRAVIVGMHRGFMPFDGVMAFEAVAREVQRYMRFLIHPCLIKRPIPFNFNKLACLKVSRENADYVLQHDELLGFYPEGIEGAFRRYRNVYQLGKFGRNEFVKFALRNQAPIVPFVTVGSAEIFPVVGKNQVAMVEGANPMAMFPDCAPLSLVATALSHKVAHAVFRTDAYRARLPARGRQRPGSGAGD